MGSQGPFARLGVTHDWSLIETFGFRRQIQEAGPAVIGGMAQRGIVG